MEDENDLENDLFEEYDNENFTESTNRPPVEDNNVDNTDASEAPAREVVTVPKRIIRNPRLKFNADRLCGERGIPILTKHFQNVKFKGKGHEKEDLNKLLSTLEHWSHRLFPSMKFEACLRQIEKLGKKRPVQTCLVKIRRDMPILSSDFVSDEDEREEMQNELEFEPPPQDAFDKLFGDSEMQQSNLTSTPTTAHSSGFALGTSFGGSLTEEQKKRMEYNKMLATERRKARMAAQQASKEDGDGRHSPSVIDPESAENTSRITAPVAQNLNQQFDSLFGGKNINESIHEDSEMNHCEPISSTENKSEELGLDELMDLVDEEDSSNQLKDNGTPSVIEASEKSTTRNLDLQFDSMFDEKDENKSIPEDSEKDEHKSNFDTEDKGEKSILDSEDKDEPIHSGKNLYESVNKDSENNLYESINEDSGKNLCKSVNKDSENNLYESINKDFGKNLCKSVNKDSENNLYESINEDFGKNLCKSVNKDSENNLYESINKDFGKNLCKSVDKDSENNLYESLNEDSGKNLCKSVNKDSENNLYESINKDFGENLCKSVNKDSETNLYESTNKNFVRIPLESISEVLKKNPCDSFPSKEDESEELGLDELMDLVDE